MKFQDLKKKTHDDLAKELDSTKLDLMRYNAKVATNSIGNDAGKIKELTKKIARIKTIQNEKPTKAAAPSVKKSKK